ncbi:MAG: alpha/beta fold hydrolase [Promethearchaeota archaeon]
MSDLIVFSQKDKKDIKIHYETYGDPQNPAILLVHGWLCNSKFWEDFIDLKDLGYFLIIPDLRGHGASNVSKDVKAETLAEDIHSLLEELKVDNVIFIGHSMGGLVAQAFYKKYPDMVKLLGLWNTGAKIPLGYGIGTAFYVLRLLFFIIGLILTYPISPLFRTFLAQGWKLGFAQKGKSPAYQKLVSYVKSMDKKAVLRAAFALSSFNGKDNLENIKVPTMLVFGEKDKFITVHQLLEYLDKKIPNSQLHVIKDTAHFSSNEDPETLKNLLIQFIKQDH